MEFKTKVELTEKWWKENGAKTLPDKGLGKALGRLEASLKIRVKPSELTLWIDKIEAPIKACDDVEKAAAATINACKKGLHDETKHVLQKTFQAELKKFRKEHEKEALLGLKSTIGKLQVDDIFVSKDNLKLFQLYAKKNLITEVVDFVLDSKKMNEKVYKEYIEEGSPQEINIDSKLRDEFKEAYENKKLGSAPWKKAVIKVGGSIKNDHLGSGKFFNYLKDKHVFQ